MGKDATPAPVTENVPSSRGATAAGRAPSETVRPAAPDGLGEQVAAVEAARTKLAQDLDQLTVEVRAQMSQRMEETAWKVVASLSAIVTGIVVRKLIGKMWSAAAHREPPTNPAAPGTSWGEGIAWALASGAAYGVGRLVATRYATEGWRRVMGVLPPGVEEVG